MTWLLARPPTVLAGAGVVLTRTSPDDTDEIVTAVNASLEHLRPWMPWAQEPATPESIRRFLEAARTGWAAGSEFNYSLRRHQGGPIVGGCGLHARQGAGVLEIGYWLHVQHTGQGMATTAAQLLTDTALGLPGVERVEIHCDEANIPSAAIPKRLGYALDRFETRPPTTPSQTDRHMIWVKRDQAASERA